MDMCEGKKKYTKLGENNMRDKLIFEFVRICKVHQSLFATYSRM